MDILFVMVMVLGGIGAGIGVASFSMRALFHFMAVGTADRPGDFRRFELSKVRVSADQGNRYE